MHLVLGEIKCKVKGKHKTKKCCLTLVSFQFIPFHLSTDRE